MIESDATISQVRLTLGFYPSKAPTIRGVPRWCDRFGQYGTKVDFGSSGTLRIVIYVENHPHRPVLWLDDYHPSEGGGCSWGCYSADNIPILTKYVHIGIIHSGRHNSPIPHTEIIPRSGFRRKEYGVCVFTSVTYTSAASQPASR